MKTTEQEDQKLSPIVINNDYAISRDRYQWILIQYKDGENKQGEPIRSEHTTYHASLLQICNTILNRAEESITSIEELRTFLIIKQEYLIAFFKELKLTSDYTPDNGYCLK